MKHETNASIEKLIAALNMFLSNSSIQTNAPYECERAEKLIAELAEKQCDE